MGTVQVLRWVFVAWFGAVAMAAIFVHVFVYHNVGSDRRRRLLVPLGIACVWAAAGAWFALPIGWYAALAVAVFTCAEEVYNWRTHAPPPFTARERTVSIALLLLEVAVLVLLVIRVGRAAFGI